MVKVHTDHNRKHIHDSTDTMTYNTSISGPAFTLILLKLLDKQEIGSNVIHDVSGHSSDSFHKCTVYSGITDVLNLKPWLSFANPNS